MKRFALLAALLALPPAGMSTGVDVAAYSRKDQFDDIKISPTGQYYAATVPLDDRTVLAVLERGTNKVTGGLNLGRNTVVNEFNWVTNDRLVVGTAEKFGALEQPRLTGELYALNADGGKVELLVGWRTDASSLGSNIKTKDGNDRIAAFLIDAPPADTRSVLISAQPYTANDAYTAVDRIDLFSGRRTRVATVPVRNANFHIDNQGAVRFAVGFESDNVYKLYHRSSDNAGWDLIGTEKDGVFEWPIGFAEDNRTAYFRAEQRNGPDALIAYDTQTGKRTEVLRDDDVDPARILYRNGTRIPVGAQFHDGRTRTAFFDASSPEARFYRSLEAAFPDSSVLITSQTADNRLALVLVSSDRNPGDFFLFDTVNKKAEHLLARAEWIDPEQQSQMRPVQLAARDGVPLHGYLTLPKGSSGKNLPMVVMPHGGPIGVQDVWGYDPQTQLLAAAGYAVLQLNFRGSSGYGQAFMSAGAREWGGKMQDDLTDASRWASQQGYADPGRVCIFGGSYGGYAALMGVAKEPGLYRCAVGYVGVYDLPTMHTHGDIQRRGSGETYLREWIGEREQLGAVSPNRMAERIKVPVLLAAGGEDERAPIAHSRMMEQALRKANVPVETLYYDTEGHGFYVEAHRQEFYTRLLAFLSRSLGGSVAATGGGEAKAAK